MADEDEPAPLKPPDNGRGRDKAVDDRKARLAAQLRTNLQKRKAQSRVRKKNRASDG